MYRIREPWQFNTIAVRSTPPKYSSTSPSSLQLSLHLPCPFSLPPPSPLGGRSDVSGSEIHLTVSLRGEYSSPGFQEMTQVECRRWNKTFQISSYTAEVSNTSTSFIIDESQWTLLYASQLVIFIMRRSSVCMLVLVLCAAGNTTRSHPIA